MKPLYIIFFSLLSFTSVYSQSSQSIQEPEYSGNFILVKDSLNATPLEKQKAINKAKAGASLYIIGVGKVTGSNIIKGQKSPIRTQQKKDLKFIVKVKDNSIDPFTQINIFSISKNQYYDS